MAKIYFFCNAVADDDADAEVPLPRFPNGLDKNTFWLLLPNNWIEWRFLHAEALKNFINEATTSITGPRLQYEKKGKNGETRWARYYFLLLGKSSSI